MTLAPYVPKGKRSFSKLIAASQVVTTSVAAASSSSIRATYSKMAFTYAGNTTLGTGYAAGVRGEMNIAAGTTLKDGFFYGTQGKVICPGTLSQTSALRLAGVMAQLDCGAGTVTAGQASALWADISGSDPASTWDGETNVIRATNSTGKAVNAHMFTYGYANNIFDLNCSTAGVVAAAGANNAGKSDGSVPADRVFKITLNGVVGYVPVFNANS